MGLYPKITSDFFTDPRFGAVQPEAGAMPPAPPMPTEPALYNSPYPAPAPTPQAPDEAPKQDRPGFLRRIRSQPGGDRALLEFGAAMLSSNTFGEGLGKGALAYRTALDNEAEKNKPQFTKDFTHTIEKDPVTGQPTFKRTAVADFEEKQLGTKLKTQEIMAKLRDDGSTARNALDNKTRFDISGNEIDASDRRLEAEKNWRSNDIKARLDAARIGASARIEAITATQNGKPPSPAIQKQITDGFDKIASYESSIAGADRVMGYLDNGELEVSFIKNSANAARNITGIGANAESVKYGEMTVFIEGLRNTILMDAKGVQTDGDAERARQALISGTGDKASILANLRIVRENLRRRHEYMQGRMTDMSGQYNVETSATQAALNTPRDKPNGRASALKAKYGLK